MKIGTEQQIFKLNIQQTNGTTTSSSKAMAFDSSLKVAFSAARNKKLSLTTNKLRDYWIKIKREYCAKDFENAGGIKNSPFVNNPAIRPIFDLFELRLKNFHKVSDKFIRGGIISCKYDIDRLKKMGVSDIINLLEPKKHNQNLAKYAESININYHHIPLIDGGMPTEQQIEDYNKIIKNAKGAVYVHCLQGKDRTGLMSFIYEVEHLNTPLDKAFRHMINFGLNVKKNFKVLDFLSDRYPKLREMVN